MASQIKTLIGALASLSAYASGVNALDFYVSPPGASQVADLGANHYTTLPKVQQAVRQATSHGLTEDVTIHVAEGTHRLTETLVLTNADSGSNGHTVTWKAAGPNTLVSGGLEVTGWVLNQTNGVYHSSVPKGTKSRNLYVNGRAANYARRAISRADFTVTSSSYNWNKSQYDWLMTTPGIANAELRSINSFTDRYAPIQSVGNRQLIMKQWSWQNNIIGYDDIPSPFADFGLYVQNALALLDEGGEHYLDSDNGIVYYKPLSGEDMSTVTTVLGVQEVLLAIGGTYDNPAHDIAMQDMSFAHSTWLRPGQGFGYADQQTGAYIGENVTYPEFEASRTHWYQMPGAIQISAAHNIQFTGGNYTQLGAGGFGIGNDAMAHQTGIGLGAVNVSVSNGYFTQVMGNSITAGGTQIPAHHPNDTRMINSGIHATENIFYNTSSLFSSTVPILYTYVQYSSIIDNDISHTPYSGICHGYGWGMNDAGGSQTYVNRGTYKYQPIFSTPTTSLNNTIQGNLIRDFGFSHTDLGGLYTLSKSPSTVLSENYILGSPWYGVYTDEGSNSLIITDNDFFSVGNLGSANGWYNPNQGYPIDPGMHTANNTLARNFGIYPPSRDFVGAPNGTGVLNNTFISNFIVGGLADITANGQRVAYRAGIPPGSRGSRPVSNPTVPDAFLGLDFAITPSSQVAATLWNFDDADYENVSFKLTSTNGTTATAGNQPSTIPGNSFVKAPWNLSVSGCTAPVISVTATYTNTRTQKTESLTTTGTLSGVSALSQGWSVSSTWPGSVAQICNSIGIRSGGRDLNGSFDDWTVAYKPHALQNSGAITAEVLSMDATSPLSKAGVALRNSFQSNAPSNNAPHVNTSGYAAVVVTPSSGILFEWDSSGSGYLSSTTTASGLKAPVWVRLSVSGQSASGYYSTDGSSWKQIGSTVSLKNRGSTSDAGVVVNSHRAFANETAIFGSITAG